MFFIKPTGTVQVIENGEYQTSVQNIWWARSEAEFKEILKKIPERKVISKYLPIEEYLE